ETAEEQEPQPYAVAPAAAAELIADLEPGRDGFIFEDISGVLSLGDRAVFALREPSSGQELWVSDGTSAGTALLRDFCPGPCSSEPVPLGVIGNTAVFLTGSEGTFDLPRGHILRTDGTKPGTRIVTSEGPFACAGGVQSGVLGDAILFAGYTPESGCKLWRTDGSEAGTRQVSDVGVSYLAAAGGRVFFTSGSGLWRSDGAAAGTVLVRSFPGFLSRLVPAGSDVLFLHYGQGFGELWRSDGTEPGTVRIAAFNSASAFGNSATLEAAQLGNRVFFRADRKIWTASAPSWQAEALPGPRVQDVSPVTEFGGRILFVGSGASEGELWSTDGTGPGTHKLATVCKFECSVWPGRIVPLLGQAFFLAGYSDEFALWRTDGTPEGTVPLAAQRRDINYRDLLAARIGDRIVFAGTDWQLGPEIWVSDGTEAGTGPLTILGSTNSSFPTGFVALGDRAAFHTQEGNFRHLWISGGTAASTVRLAERIEPRDDHEAGVQAGELLFFEKYDGKGNSPLWRTDGTQAGTFRIGPEDVTVTDLAAFGSKVAAVLFPSQGPSSLWESDGTPAGTRKLFDHPTHPHFLTGLGTEIWFVADTAGPTRLYRFVGTPAGPQAVTGQDLNFAYRPLLARLGAQTFFTHIDTGLWRTDGTPAGTVRILELPSATADVLFLDLKEHLGSLYVLRRDGLWKSDGTAAGSGLLRTFTSNPGATPSLTPLGAHLYFAADDGEHGLELWRTDGITTELVTDLVPGWRSSNPQNLEAAGGRLFFTAGTEEHGREIWETDGTEEGTH
ncbi:MAG TPA: hypothetical protein VFR31_22925, partial [Thermoanaerobaculia bacterium]|nr:hypothetical protein [Thermoanaerobaculia bacterium]